MIVASCRFCESEKTHFAYFGGENGAHVSKDERWYAVAVACDRCGATGPHQGRSGWVESEEDAVALWNRDTGMNYHVPLTRLASEIEEFLAGDDGVGETARSLLDRSRRDLEAYSRVLSDPQAVHLNMLRGSIAPISRMNLLHLAGATDYDFLSKQIEALRHRAASADHLVSVLRDEGSSEKDREEAELLWLVRQRADKNTERKS